MAVQCRVQAESRGSSSCQSRTNNHERTKLSSVFKRKNHEHNLLVLQQKRRHGVVVCGRLDLSRCQVSHIQAWRHTVPAVTHTGYQARRNTMSLISTLSSNDARNCADCSKRRVRAKSQHANCTRVALVKNNTRTAPGGVDSDFLIWPRIPDTVRIAAPSNLATSSALLNMPRTKAVLWKT
jgi:hypothetical protein